MCLNHQFAQFDQQRANAFADRLINALNEGAVCQLISIGHRTGLFDTLSRHGGGNSATIAEQAGLNERYVREWLNGMTVGKIVHYDPGSCHYHLPHEHASFLTREATPDNIAVFAQYIPMMGTVENEIIECFKHGGGVPYERYERFHEVMAEDSGQTVVSSLLDNILPLVPGLIERLQSGIRVLDVGCGRGRALQLLAESYPASEFVGVDLSPEAIDYGKALAEQAGLSNLRFRQQDVTHLARDAKAQSFDLITTFDAIHDQARPLAVLKGIYQALKPDGVYLMQDINGSSHVENNQDHPIGPLLYAISTMHCMTVSLAQGGDGLGTMWGREKASELLLAAGFNDINVFQLDHDFQNDYYVIRK